MRSSTRTPQNRQPIPARPDHGVRRLAGRSGFLGAVAVVGLLAACSSGSSSAQPGSHRTTTTARHSGGGNPTATTRATPSTTAPTDHGGGHGAVTLASDLPLSRSGLTCSTIDGETFVQSGSLNAEFFTLSYMHTARTASNWALGWQTDPQHTAISGGTLNPMTVTLNPDGTSGGFEGEAVIAIAGQQPSRTSFTGTFECP